MMKTETNDYSVWQDYAVDKNIPIPLYYQLSNAIKDVINKGILKPGDSIPTESDFKDIYNLSATTIRKAISELVHDNIVETRRPKGVFVCKPKLEEYSNGYLTSFTEEFEKGGYVPSSKILQFEDTQVYGSIASELKLPEGAMAHYIYRLRYINGSPVTINYDYINGDLVPNINIEDFTETGITQSLYYTLRNKYGVKLMKAEETVNAISLSPAEAELMEAASGTPVISRKRIAYDEENRPVLAERSIILYAYKTTLVGKP